MDAQPAIQPLVSVVIPLYNGERFIAATLDSALAQDYPRVEILVVDDGSTDHSLRVAREYAARHGDRIRVLIHPGGANRGVSATRNLALAEARGEWIAFLDADDLWYPKKLSRQMAALARAAHASVCYTLSDVLREGRGQAFIPGETRIGSHPLPEDPQDVLLQIIKVQINYIFSSVVVHAATLRDIGGFEENLPFQSEDRLMVARATAVGSLLCIPEVLCTYRAHESSYTASVIADRVWPAVFYDVQVRMLVWLRRRGLNAPARAIARYVLPVHFVRAAVCSLQPRILRIVFLDFLRSLWHAPMIPAYMAMKLAGFIFSGRLFSQGKALWRRTALARRWRSRRDPPRPRGTVS